ncbi:MAG: hypothetical protein FWG19_03935 [Methanomassiliicoccaceae archaeon]|nr:hypothetical protein [Methanomassiliicoccaceae archaeon]
MFSITVRSEKEDKRIPIAVASDVMFDIQLLLTHIGESLISEEFGSYNRPAEALVGRFTLFMDPDSGGISFRTSAGNGPSTLMDKAMNMLKVTMDKMGSGSGTYWMEDNFKDPVYRSMVLFDLMELSKHMSPERGFSLIFGIDDKERTFVPLDIEKGRAFLSGKGKSSRGNIVGILHGVQSKRNVPLYGFTVGDDRVKISFRSKDVESDAAKHVNSPVLVNGTLRYSDEGELLEVADIDSAELFDKKAFTHMISADRDVPLARPLEASVSYDASSQIWKLTYPDLGISSSDQEWDTAVAGLHDYFVFLCDNYLSKDDNELSEEEAEVKNTLNSLIDSA